MPEEGVFVRNPENVGYICEWAQICVFSVIDTLSKCLFSYAEDNKPSQTPLCVSAGRLL